MNAKVKSHCTGNKFNYQADFHNIYSYFFLNKKIINGKIMSYRLNNKLVE